MGYLDDSAEYGPGPAPGSVAYLDHAATTPMVPEALASMTAELPWVGNPSSLHNAGRRARRVVEESREQIAAALGARPSEVIFTSGGTEADNLAVKGLFWARQAADPRRRRVLVGAAEHHAVLDSVRWLAEQHGAQPGWLEVDACGRVRPEVLRAAIEADPDSVAMVSVMRANNEVGTVAPVAELAAIAHEYGIWFHTDAVQAVGQLPVDFAAYGADAMTVTGHKIGGPVGAGALLLGRGVEPVPVLHGGGQERDVRSGMRGRCAAHAARREGHRVFDRVGVHRRRGPAQPCAARDGRRGSPRPGVAAVLPRPHVVTAGRGRGGRGDSRGGRAGPPGGRQIASSETALERCACRQSPRA